ncbi:MAG: hypothetical protein U0234_02455 [Sandaracinus sp.]
MRGSFIVGSVLAAWLVAGCGGGARAGGGTLPRASQPLVHAEPFPTSAVITALPPPGPVQVDEGVAVGDWEIEAASLAPVPGPIEPLYAELAAQRATAQRSTALECVARELARFVGTLHGLPSEPVRRFLLARCGAGVVSAGVGVLPLEGRGSDEDLLRHLHDEVLTQAVGVVVPEANRVGLATYRVGDALFVGVVSALAQTDVAPAVPVADGGRARFALTIQRAPNEILVMTTSGPRGFASCTVGGSPPQLDVDCPFTAGDAYAYVEVLGRDGEAVLCMPLAMMIAVPSGEAGRRYTLRRPSEPAPFAGADLGTAVLPLLNGERTQAGLPPLALSAEQSAANASVAPYAFAPDRHAMEQALLYSMAGWQIGPSPGLREGRTIQVDAGRATDAGAWLFQALETPLERWVLLDPEARVLAIGAQSSDGHTFGLASTYRFFDRDADGDRAAAEAALTEARRAAGRPDPAFVRLPGADRAAEQIVRGADPTAAVDGALAEAVQSYASARGAAYVGSVIEGTRWSPEILAAPHVALAVRHVQPEGMAWGVYVIVVVALP